MRIDDWQDYYDTLAIDSFPDDGKIWRPSDEDFDGFESASGFKLPHSYRQFLKVFGPGRLGGFVVDVAAPGYPGTEFFDLASTSRPEIVELNAKHAPPEQCSLFERLIYFGSKSEDHQLAWDPTHSLDPGNNEVMVYEVRDDMSIHPRGTFRELIESTDDWLREAEAKETEKDDPNEVYWLKWTHAAIAASE